jgi:PAS domain S-box-containing protein
VEQHLGRLSVMAEEMRAQLLYVQTQLSESGKSLPRGVLEGLRQLSGTLALLQESVEERELDRRNLRALTELGAIINSSLDLEVVLNEVIDTMIRLTGAGRAFLMLRDDSGKMEIVIARNWERESIDRAEHEVSDTIVKRVVSTGDPVLTTNAQADPRFDNQASIVAYSLRSILCVPLKVKGDLTGVIYADNKIREGLFSDREKALVTAFSHQAAVALENARLFQSVRDSLDEVTELKILMEDILASIVSGVLTSDVNDRVTLANKAATEILSQARSELEGSHILQLLDTLDPSIPQRLAEVKAKDMRFLGLEVITDAIDGETRQLRVHLSPLKSADGESEGVAIVLDDLTEQRQLEAQQRLFERMVSPAVIDQLNPDSIHLGGSRKVITALFADIRGYTAFSESMSPEELVMVLNRYLAVAAEALMAEEGTIDKFLGDAVMAWFNAPAPQPDHTLRAVRAALAIRRAVSALHDQLPEHFHLSYGVGIHTGEALLGLVGTRERLDYTAVGDCVNVAKRLQENAAEGEILISPAVFERAQGSLDVGEMRQLVVAGKSAPILAYPLHTLK